MENIQVAIPTYNRSNYLDALLSTIPNNIKVVISDNGNMTSNKIKAKYGNAIFIEHEVVIDIFKNWNSAAKNINSEWCIIPSDDDIFLENAFEIVKDYIEKYSDKDILIFGHVVIDENSKSTLGWCCEKEIVATAPTGYDVFKYGVNARMPSIIFKTDFLKSLGYFNENFILTAADSHLIQRSLLYGNAVFINKIISGYRVWGGGLTSLKVGTKKWLDEIDYWQNSIGIDVKKAYKKAGKNIYFPRIRDEVYCQNLLLGIYNIKIKYGIKEAVTFLRSVRYPTNAKFKTQLRLIKTLLFR